MIPVCSVIGDSDFDHLVKIAACLLKNVGIFTHSDFTSFNCTVQLF